MSPSCSLVAVSCGPAVADAAMAIMANKFEDPDNLGVIPLPRDMADEAPDDDGDQGGA